MNAPKPHSEAALDAARSAMSQRSTPLGGPYTTSDGINLEAANAALSEHASTVGEYVAHASVRDALARRGPRGPRTDGTSPNYRLALIALGLKQCEYIGIVERLSGRRLSNTTVSRRAVGSAEPTVEAWALLEALRLMRDIMPTLRMARRLYGEALDAQTENRFKKLTKEIEELWDNR